MNERDDFEACARKTAKSKLQYHEFQNLNMVGSALLVLLIILKLLNGGADTSETKQEDLFSDNIQETFVVEDDASDEMDSLAERNTSEYDNQENIDILDSIKECALFNSDYGLSASCGNVLNRYISSAEWGIYESEGIDYVEVSGIIKGTEESVLIVIGTMPNLNEADSVFITSILVKVGDMEFLPEEDSLSFLYYMFAAYEEGYSDVSELVFRINRLYGQEIELSEIYTSDAKGISFQYPRGWKIVENDASVTGMETQFLSLPNEIEYATEFSAYIKITKTEVDQNMVNQLFKSDQEFALTYGNDVSIITTAVTEIDGNMAKKVDYTIYGEPEFFGRSYFYAIDSCIYEVQFICMEDMAESFSRVFDTIMDSYAITITSQDSLEITYPDETDQPIDDMESAENYEKSVETDLSYDQLLNQYITAVIEKWDTSKLRASNMDDWPVYCDDLSSVGYAYWDINGDGIDELLIGNCSSGKVTEIYTLIDEKAVSVFRQSEWVNGYFCTNGIIANQLSGDNYKTYYDYYRLSEDGKLHIYERILFDGGDEGAGYPFYYVSGTDMSDAILISDDRAFEIIDGYIEAGITFIPLQ